MSAACLNSGGLCVPFALISRSPVLQPTGLNEPARSPKAMLTASNIAARGSRETRLGPTRLERDAHQGLRTLLAEHPNPIHPGVNLVIDAGATSPGFRQQPCTA